MKTIIEAIFAAVVMAFTLTSCEKNELEDLLANVDGDIGGEEWSRPTKDGTVIETGVVDLGLSVKWSACNLTSTGFAPYCFDEGGKFAWSSSNLANPPEEIGGSQYDNATKILGAKWSTPSKSQWEELRTRCRITDTKYRGVSGQIITGKGGNAIFVPYNTNGRYIYWTSTLDLNSNNGFCLSMYDLDSYWFSFGTQIRTNTYYIRPVCK